MSRTSARHSIVGYPSEYEKGQEANAAFASGGKPALHTAM